MFPSVGPATEATMGGAMMGTAAMVGMGVGLMTIMGISFICRRCGYRGTVERSQYNGRCTKCGDGIYKRDARRVKMQKKPEKDAIREVSVLEAENPVDVLKMRLAKGEISPEDYEARLKLIQGT